MNYKLILSPKSNLFLKKIEKKMRKRIENKLRDLKTSPNLGIALSGRLSGLWSLRIGDYRAIYRIVQGELIILVLKIGHRKNAYGGA